MRIIPHIKWALINGAENLLVLSNDTDVLALLLYYLSTYKEYGLKQLWIRIGSGEKQRFIPVHTLGKKLGPELCKVVLKLHIDTGCDYLSQVGTKKSALKADPILHLYNFATCDQINEEDIKSAECFLIKVLTSDRSIKTFDDRRLRHFTQKVLIMHLPPTSFFVVHGHISRWWYIIMYISA